MTRTEGHGPQASEANEHDAADPRVTPARYVTGDEPGIGGRLKERPEDFLVDEIPLYQPSGEGEHVYLFVEKRGMATIEMLNVLARHFGVQRSAIGHAGLKDKHAITRQTVSVHVPGKAPEDFPQLQHPNVTVLWADLHTNKLRRGHLAGNRFSIKVRGVQATDALRAQRAMETLTRVGLPNRFGEQRFGILQNNHLVARAALRQDFPLALELLLGPSPTHTDHHAEARSLFMQGEYTRAKNKFPHSMRAEQSALRKLAAGKEPRQAFFAIDPAVRRYYFSAFQSAVFNRVLDMRLEAGTLDTLQPGDIAMKAENRACFSVTEPVALDPETRHRLEGFAIAPTGPMWGPEMMRANGQIDTAELDALGAYGVRPEDLAVFAKGFSGMLEGARRPLRVPVSDAEVEGGVDEHGAYVRCVFDLPRGCFATSLMLEIMKAPSGAEEDTDE